MFRPIQTLAEIKLGKSGDEHILIGKTPGDKDDDESGAATVEKVLQTKLNFDELQGAIYARMVERVGNRRYWENRAKDIAKIAERHKQQILKLTDKPEFKNFIKVFLFAGFFCVSRKYFCNQKKKQNLRRIFISP